MASRIRKQYSQMIAYVKTNYKWCLLTLLILIEFIVFACLNTVANDHYGDYVAQTTPEYSSLFWFIFCENTKTAMWIILYGTIPLGLGMVFGLYFVTTNLVATVKWLLPSVGGWKMLACTFPHGVFELSAFVVSVVVAALWSKMVTISLLWLIRGKPTGSALFEEAKSQVRIVALVQLPLLLIAAIIEVTVSSWLVLLVKSI